jgi:hypothetical protein
MGRGEQIAIILLGLIVLGTAGVALFARRLYRELAPSPRGSLGCRPRLSSPSCVTLAFLGVPLFALFPLL